MHKTDLRSVVNYLPEGPYRKIFYDKGHLKAQIVCLKHGQMIPPCKMDNDVLFYVIEGEGEITVDDEKEDLLPAVAVVVPKEAESRSIFAKTDMIILAVQSKGK